MKILSKIGDAVGGLILWAVILLWGAAAMIVPVAILKLCICYLMQ